MTQFIAGPKGTEPRTWAKRPQAAAGADRELKKFYDTNPGVDLVCNGIDTQKTGDGRWGVVLYVDIPAQEAKTAVTKSDVLNGFVIEPSGRTTAPAASTKTSEEKPKRRKGEVNVSPMDSLIPARDGSKQQKLIDALAKEDGATMDDLRAICQKKDGSGPWEDGSIRSGLYYDVHQKGYGVQTIWKGDDPTYHLVLPEGVSEPMPAKISGTASKTT